MTDIQKEATTVTKSSTPNTDLADAARAKVDKENAVQLKEGLKAKEFNSSETEAGYKAWRSAVARSPDLQGLDYEGLKSVMPDAGTKFGLSTQRDMSVDETLDSFRARLADEQQMKADAEKTVAPAKTPLKEGQGYSLRGLKFEAADIAVRLTKGYEQTATYNKMADQPQIKAVAEMAQNDPDRVFAIIRGEEALPENILPGFMLAGAEDMKNSVTDLSIKKQMGYDLANSTLDTLISKGAQAMRSAQAIDPDSSVAQFDQIKENMSKGEPQGKEKDVQVKKDTQDLSDRIKKARPTKDTLSAFVHSLRCPPI